MKVVIPGGSGQVGQLVARALAADGDEVVVLSRGDAVAAGRAVHWDGHTLGLWAAELDGADLVLNLAGIRDFVRGCRELGVAPHVAQNTSFRSGAIDGRTARQEGYRVSQRIRTRIEEIFGWLKTVGGGRKPRYIGVRRNQLWTRLAVTAFNLVRIGTLMAEPA